MYSFHGILINPFETLPSLSLTINPFTVDPAPSITLIPLQGGTRDNMRGYRDADGMCGGMQEDGVGCTCCH